MSALSQGFLGTAMTLLLGPVAVGTAASCRKPGSAKALGEALNDIHLARKDPVAFAVPSLCVSWLFCGLPSGVPSFTGIAGSSMS